MQEFDPAPDPDLRKRSLGGPMPSPLARAPQPTMPLVLSLALGLAGLAGAEPLPLSWTDFPYFDGAREHAAVVDPVRDRLLVSGGSTSEDDLYSLDLNSLQWTRLGSFDYRKQHAAVYDPERDAMMYYGGWSNTHSVSWQDGYRIDLATNTWSTLGPAGWMPPGERTNFTLLLDSAHDRLLILNREFGGDSVYSYNIITNTWSAQASVGQYPAHAVGFGAVVDAANDRVIALTDQVRQMTLSGAPAWSIITPGGTAPPSLAGRAIMDAARSRLLLFKDDMTVWALSLGAVPAWSQVFSSGTAPSARGQHSIALDAERDRALLCGGWISPSGPQLKDTWAFDFASNTWTLLLGPTGVPPWRTGHAAVRASSLDAMLVFGGNVATSNQVVVVPLAGGSSGYHLPTTGTPPVGRTQASAAYDSGHDRLIVFGGKSFPSNALLNDVWALTLGATPTWSELSIPGGPSAREGSVACYDPIRDRLLVFGGRSEASPYGTSDCWALSLSETPAWELLLQDGILSPIYSASLATYDSPRDRMVVVGNRFDISALGVYALSLSGVPSATDLAPAGPNPGERMFLAGAHDTFDDRLLFFGGLHGTGFIKNELTSLSLGDTPTWTQHTIPNMPLPHDRNTLVYDPIRHRSLLYGGLESWGPEWEATAAGPMWLVADAATPALASLVSSEVVDREARLEWLVSDADYTVWTVERSFDQAEWEAVGEPIVEVGGHVSFRDPNLPAGASVGYRLVATENGVARRMGETWVAVPAHGDALALTRASFVDGQTLRWAAVLPGAGEARLDVFDVGGRRVGSALLSAGRAEQQGELRLGQPARAGIYFARLSQAGMAVSRRLVLTD